MDDASRDGAVAADRCASLAELFLDRVRATPTHIAHLVRRDAVWVPSTWADVGTAVEEVAYGLLALGQGRGEAVGILARSRAEWVVADFAVFSIGGVTVPIYPTSTPDEIAYIVNDANVRTLIVEGGQPLARARAARPHMPNVRHLIGVDEPAEATHETVGWHALRALGRAHVARATGDLAARIAAVRATDVASVVYTSGTTGTPKGVVQTHGNHLAMLQALAGLPGVHAGDVHLLLLPLAHAFARMEAFLAVHRGLITAFAEGFEGLPEKLREVRPHFFFAVPRLFERAHARIVATAQASQARRALFRGALTIGGAVSARKQRGLGVPWPLRVAHAVAQRLVIRRLRAAFGGRLRFAVSGGAPLGRDVANFFHAIGIPVLEGYGLTEACPVLTWNRLDDFRLGSVGRPLPGVEVRLAADGEILARGPNIARGYLNKPDETAAVFGADGWLRTGDVGYVDQAGFLFITDRKKDLLVTSGGFNVAPQPIEGMLRRDPVIAEAMLYGDHRPFVTALLTLDREAVQRFVRSRGLPAMAWTTLVKHPAVLARVRAVVEATNGTLPAHARVRRFAILAEAFTEAGGELTPTQKVRRRVVADRHRDLLEGLYRRDAGDGVSTSGEAVSPHTATADESTPADFSRG